MKYFQITFSIAPVLFSLNVLSMLSSCLFCYDHICDCTVLQYPSTCGSAKVVSVVDLTVGYDSSRPPDYKPVSNH